MSLIPVYDWEIEISHSMDSLPRSGPLFDFFLLCSYPPRLVWIALFVILIGLLIKCWPRFNQVLLTTVIAAGIGDLISRRIFKVVFERPRPGSLIAGCSSPHCWGFISSHATNTSAAATVLCLYDKRNAYWCVPLCLLVDLSRIYLIDHFPLDVLCGSLVGMLIGAMIWRMSSIRHKSRDRAPNFRSKRI